MKTLFYLLSLAVVCSLAAGCQTAKQVTYLEMLTSTNAIFVAKSISDYTDLENRISLFLDYNLQNTATEYNINTNLNLFVLSVEDKPKVAEIAQSLNRESEADAQTVFGVQSLISPANSIDDKIAAQIKSMVTAKNAIADGLVKLAGNESLVDEAKFMGGYASGVYETVKKMQKEAQASANATATNSIPKTN
jgi:hypothetical protein